MGLFILVCGLVLFPGVHLVVARRFERLHVFAQTNVLFDADVRLRLQAIAGGRHLGIKHPNLMAYCYPPIALAAKAIVRLRPASGTEADVRQSLGILLVPAASAVKTALVFLLFSRLGLSVTSAAVATLLELVSFTTLVFGSIPESYGLTALALALMYVWAARQPASGHLTRGQLLGWLVLGVSLPALAPVLTQAFDEGLRMMLAPFAAPTETAR